MTRHFGGPLGNGHIYLLKVEGNAEEEIIRNVDSALHHVKLMEVKDYQEKVEILESFLYKLGVKFEIHIIEEGKLYEERND